MDVEKRKRIEEKGRKVGTIGEFFQMIEAEEEEAQRRLNREKKILALDLEGTIVSNAISRKPRPGLYAFMESCKDAFNEVVLFTAVDAERARDVLLNLAKKCYVPMWVATMPIVLWHEEDDIPGKHLIQLGKFKDLLFVKLMFPGVVIPNIWIVDDNRYWVRSHQRRQLIEIPTWDPAFNGKNSRKNDRALEEVIQVLSVIKKV